jgi:ribosomal protein S18 acetylase RimI-like enzyme
MSSLEIQSSTPSNGSNRRPHVSVRLATSRDLSALASLFDAYRVFYGRVSDLGAAHAFLAERLTRNESVILMSELRRSPSAAGEPVGFAQLYRSFSSVSLCSIAVLNDLYVAPRARRLGVASGLIDAAVEYARQAGAMWLQLETHPHNEPAIQLYASKGFVAVTEFAQLMLPLVS